MHVFWIALLATPFLINRWVKGSPAGQIRVTVGPIKVRPASVRGEVDIMGAGGLSLSLRSLARKLRDSKYTRKILDLSATYGPAVSVVYPPAGIAMTAAGNLGKRALKGDKVAIARLVAARRGAAQGDQASIATLQLLKASQLASPEATEADKGAAALALAKLAANKQG